MRYLVALIVVGASLIQAAQAEACGLFPCRRYCRMMLLNGQAGSAGGGNFDNSGNAGSILQTLQTIQTVVNNLNNLNLNNGGSALTGRVTALEGKVTTIEGQITTINSDVAAIKASIANLVPQPPSGFGAPAAPAAGDAAMQQDFDKIAAIEKATMAAAAADAQLSRFNALQKKAAADATAAKAAIPK